MGYCTKCGKLLKEDELFCTSCGSKVRFSAGDGGEQGIKKPEIKQKNNSGGMSRGEKKETKLPRYGKVVSNPESNRGSRIEKSPHEINDYRQMGYSGKASSGNGRKDNGPDVTRKSTHEEEKSRKNASQSGSKSLWTWLKKNETRDIYYEEKGNLLDENEYMQIVREKLFENKVNASIDIKHICWDQTTMSHRFFCINPVTHYSNPLTSLLQFKKVGKFTFVEEKTFISPPDLPEPPQKPIPEDPALHSRKLFMIWGIVLSIIGKFMIPSNDSYYDMMQSSPLKAIGSGIIICGLVLFGIGLAAFFRLKAIREHNKKCEEQEKLWNQCWKDWENHVLLYSFQESTNGEISRILEAVRASIKQVNKELFGKEHTKEEESNNYNELMQVIALHKEELR